MMMWHASEMTVGHHPRTVLLASESSCIYIIRPAQKVIQVDAGGQEGKQHFVAAAQSTFWQEARKVASD
jgi:hypothetical protein